MSRARSARCVACCARVAPSTSSSTACAPIRRVAHKQHRFNGLQQRMCGGCHLDRPIDALGARGGLRDHRARARSDAGPEVHAAVGLPLRGRGDAHRRRREQQRQRTTAARRVGSTRTSVASGWAGCSPVACCGRRSNATCSATPGSRSVTTRSW